MRTTRGFGGIASHNVSSIDGPIRRHIRGGQLRKREITEIGEAAIVVIGEQRDGFVTLSFASSARVHLLAHFGSNGLTLFDPLLPVLFCIRQVFIRRHTENAALFQFLGEGNHVKVQEANFTLVPILSGIRVNSPLSICVVQLFIESLVPLAINLPVSKRDGG